MFTLTFQAYKYNVGIDVEPSPSPPASARHTGTPHCCKLFIHCRGKSFRWQHSGTAVHCLMARQAPGACLAHGQTAEAARLFQFCCEGTNIFGSCPHRPQWPAAPLCGHPSRELQGLSPQIISMFIKKMHYIFLLTSQILNQFLFQFTIKQLSNLLASHSFYVLLKKDLNCV